MNMKFSLRWLTVFAAAALAGGLMFPGMVAAADVGRVVQVAGGVSLQRGTQVENVKAGSILRTGDVLLTGGDGRVQWQTADEAISVLAPNSRFAFQEYSYQSGGGGTSQSEFIKGALSTITGSIQSPGYKVVTPAADITVDGTKYKSIICKGTCGELPDGMYVSVVEGKVTVSNGAGSLTGGVGQFIFVSGRDSAPKFVDVAPKFFASLTVDFDFTFDADGFANIIERPLSPS